MIWEPEDWGITPGDTQERIVPRGELFRSISPLLARIPERGAQRVAWLDRPAAGPLAFLSAHFSEVVVLRVERFESDREAGGAAHAERRFDVIVAPRPARFQRAIDLDRRFEAWFTNLTEGGLIVAAFPAVRRYEGPAALPLIHGDQDRLLPRLHELQLQYRLRRAGFRGVRLRRLDDECAGAVFVCTAVRRANN